MLCRLSSGTSTPSTRWHRNPVHPRRRVLLEHAKTTAPQHEASERARLLTDRAEPLGHVRRVTVLSRSRDASANDYRRRSDRDDEQARRATQRRRGGWSTRGRLDRPTPGDGGADRQDGDHDTDATRVERAGRRGQQRHRNEEHRADHEKRRQGQPRGLEVQSTAGEAWHVRMPERPGEIRDERRHVSHVLDSDQQDERHARHPAGAETTVAPARGPGRPTSAAYSGMSSLIPATRGS